MKPIGAFLFAFGVLASTSIVAQTPFQRLDVVSGDFSDLLTDQTAANGPEFGFSVAISGEWMAVGAPATVVSPEFGDRRGAIFMFRNQGDEWQLMQRIIQSGRGQDTRCGHSVALSGDYLVFGCPGRGSNDKNADNEAGATWIYKKHNNQEWVGETFFPSLPPAVADGGRCGTAVDVVTSFLPTSPFSVMAVSSCPGFDSGKGVVRVYAFDGNEWSLNPDISASDGANGDSFGSALALTISCDFVPPAGISCLPRLAVGAPTKQHGNAILAGAVYVYAGNDLNETDIFTHESPSTFGATLFGISVDINSSQLLVGSSGAYTTNCPNAPRCGRTLRWERDGSNWNSTVGGGAVNVGGTPPGEQVGMQFGRSVALGFDNWIAIGAPQTDGGDAGFGGTYEGLGMVELRRNSNGDWGNSWGDSRGELRPDNFPFSLDYDDSQFGASVAFGGQRWLAVGVPRWLHLSFPGPVEVRHGQVWMYAQPDGIFNDRFEQ